MRIVLQFVFLLSLTTLFAQSSIVSFSGYKNYTKISEPLRSVTDNGVEGIQVSYHFDAMNSISKENKSEIFQQLFIQGYSHIQEVGKPAMPAHIDLIAIPEGAEYELVISHDVALVKNGFKIYPALQPARDTEGAPEPEFEIQRDFYGKDQLYPMEPVIIKDIITIRGLRFAMVQVSPVQYNPATDQLFLHENLHFEMKFKSANRFIDCSKHSKQALDILSNYPLNAESIKNEAKQYFSGKTGFLTTIL